MNQLFPAAHCILRPVRYQDIDALVSQKSIDQIVRVDGPDHGTDSVLTAQLQDTQSAS
ncbi:MAG: hypothetical protein WA895_07680 [Streptosporangiaceae bacterium]